MQRHFTKGDTWMTNKHMKICLTSLAFSEMQIKLTVRDHYMMPVWIKLKRLTIPSIVEDNQLAIWFITLECKVVHPLWKTVLSTLSYHLTIPLLDSYPRERIFVHWHTCMWMFTAALFIHDPNWKEPKCSLTGKWVKSCGISI